MADVGAWLLAVCGLAVVGIGVFFVALRPPLLPEDRRYIAAPRESLDVVLPGLGRWLEKVFWVMGGYMVATGVLTVYVALSGVRNGSATGWVVAYLCRSPASTSGVTVAGGVGGLWARWSGRVECVRAPGLISVRDPAFGVGDVMVDGVFPRGDALRPLGLWRPSTFWWRQQHAGSGPRGIG